MDEFSDNKDNNGIGLFIGWQGMKNEKLRRLIPQIRGWHVLLALSERHNYPYLWHMPLRQGINDNFATCRPPRQLTEWGAADEENFGPTLERDD